MTVALLVMTDGRRDCITRTIPSMLADLHGPISRFVIHDDSADPEYRSWLRDRFPTFTVVGADRRLGFGGAIRNAWAHLRGSPQRFVFHLEDDFILTRSVDLLDLMRVLDRQRHLVQLALRRQPWNAEERAAGGIVEQHPEDYIEHGDDGGHRWLEHRRFFTTNPSLYRMDLCWEDWPEGAESEGRFTHQLLVKDPARRFGFWGARDSGEWVEHIGHERVGVGY